MHTQQPQILLTGGTGFMGQSLCQRLIEEQYSLCIYSRQPTHRVKALCSESVMPIQHFEQIPESIRHVINLAGEPIAAARWTKARKNVLWNSRVTLTHELVNLLGQKQPRISTYINASAIGFYGNGEDERLDEQSPVGDDFAAQLCSAWETEVNPLLGIGVRTCILRLGVVLAAQGGFLEPLKIPFRLGLGAKLGKGTQWLSWIARDDVIEIIMQCLKNEDFKGVYNATSPNPVTNKEFTQTFASNLHRPACFSAPESVLKLALGEMSNLMLFSQKVMPTRLQAQGFQHRWPHLKETLQYYLP